MKIERLYYLICFQILISTSLSCTEEIEFKAKNFESVIVIEATITNEFKKHQILLSKTHEFDYDGIIPETNAEVSIEYNNDRILFKEIDNGIYQSIEAFNALSNVEYRLKITTSNLQVYKSNPVKLSANSIIDNVYAEKGENGISIYLDSYDSSGSPKYYRYTYEEAYKIIAPKWAPEDVIVIDPTWPECSVSLIPKKEEKRICYTEDISNTIIQTTTTSLSEDRVQHFLIKSISKNDAKISWRYSILVKQYIQSKEAFNYYKILQNFSDQESIFSQTQPGFFNGNLYSETSASEKVIGFFEVASISEKRIFFNYNDFYPNEDRPSYFTPCYEFSPVQNQGHPTDRCGSLIDGILANEIVYFEINPNPIPEVEGPLIMVPRACGDCTALGSNIAPEYWIE